MNEVKKYIEANKDRFVNELFDLLRIPSVSAQSEHKPDMQRCAEWLAAALKKAGADRAEVMQTEGPGSSSQDQYPHFEDRGNEFKNIVNKIKA